MIIHPISDMSLFSTGQKYAPTAANFPGLKHFFMCNEATAATSLTDSISGLTIDSGASDALTNNANGTVTLSAAYTNIASGTLASPGTKKVLLVWAGSPASTQGNVIIGSIVDANQQGIRSTANGSGTTTPALSYGSGSTITGTAGLAGTGSQMQVRCLVLDFGTDATGGTFGMSPFDFDGTTWTARTATSIALASAGLPAINQAITIGSGTKPAFIQVWHLTSVPENIRNAVTWMFAMATTSSLGYRKLAYPGWAGLS